MILEKSFDSIACDEIHTLHFFGKEVISSSLSLPFFLLIQAVTTDAHLSEAFFFLSICSLNIYKNPIPFILPPIVIVIKQAC